MQLTERDMRKQMPFFITDPSNRAKIDALLSDNSETADGASALPTETTRQIAQ